MRKLERNKGGFSEMQYRFRKAKATYQATLALVSILDLAALASYNIATIDTDCKSAFNWYIPGLIKIKMLAMGFFPPAHTHASRWCRPTLKLPITPTQLPTHHLWPYAMPSLFVRQCVACTNVMRIGMQRKMIAMVYRQQTNLAGSSNEMRWY